MLNVQRSPPGAAVSFAVVTGPESGSLHPVGSSALASHPAALSSAPATGCQVPRTCAWSPVTVRPPLSTPEK